MAIIHKDYEIVARKAYGFTSLYLEFLVMVGMLERKKREERFGEIEHNPYCISNWYGDLEACMYKFELRTGGSVFDTINFKDLIVSLHATKNLAYRLTRDFDKCDEVCQRYAVKIPNRFGRSNTWYWEVLQGLPPSAEIKQAMKWYLMYIRFMQLYHVSGSIEDHLGEYLKHYASRDLTPRRKQERLSDAHLTAITTVADLTED